MNHQVDLTKLFYLLDTIVCSFTECIDQEETKYFISAGYIADNIVLKLDDADYVSVSRFETESPKKAMQMMERIIEERGLIIKIITFYFDWARANITSDFYLDNEIQYSFHGRSRSGEQIKLSYRLYTPDINYQDLCDNYVDFKGILSQNDCGLGVAEVSPNPNHYLRKSKLQDLLVD